MLGGFSQASTDPQRYGVFGDYVGGVWGTIISLITLVVVWRTWASTQRATRLQGVTTILSEMLKTHDAIAGGGSNGFWDRSGTPAVFLREFAAIYRQTRKVEPSDAVWPITTRIDISYTFAFFGLNVQARRSLAIYDDAKIKLVQDAVSKLRERGHGRWSDLFKGHQTTLSHYLRNLFGMYLMIDKSGLPTRERMDLAKIIRTKLSNYDQALLMLNVVSHLGRAWETEDLVRRYKPFANIPRHFFGWDEAFDMKVRFPAVLFEWEHRLHGSPKIWSRRLGSRTFVVQADPALVVPLQTQ